MDVYILSGCYWSIGQQCVSHTKLHLETYIYRLLSKVTDFPQKITSVVQPEKQCAYHDRVGLKVYDLLFQGRSCVISYAIV